MDILLKAHPLYGELARLEDDAVVLELRTASDLPQQSQALLLGERENMRRELQTAMEHTRKELADIRRSYITRENEAIARIFAENGVSGSSADAIERRITAVSQEQMRSVDRQAREGFEEYRAQLIAQSDAALVALRESFLHRADRAYRAQAEAYVQKEAAFTLEQVKQDALERLLLRTRLSNLSLNEPERAEAKARLTEMENKEADALATVRNRDQADLAAYRSQLQERVRGEVQGEARDIQARTNEKLRARAEQVRTGLLGRLQTVPVPAALPSIASGALSSKARAELDRLHTRYQAAYERDAEQTVREFAGARDEFSARLEQLAGIDRKAQESAREEIASLRKQRESLYAQMIAQINREVGAVAERRGVRFVVGKVVSSTAGVDLTDDALHEIESLHE